MKNLSTSNVGVDVIRSVKGETVPAILIPAAHRANQGSYRRYDPVAPLVNPAYVVFRFGRRTLHYYDTYDVVVRDFRLSPIFNGNVWGGLVPCERVGEWL